MSSCVLCIIHSALNMIHVFMYIEANHIYCWSVTLWHIYNLCAVVSSEMTCIIIIIITIIIIIVLLAYLYIVFEMFSGAYNVIMLLFCDCSCRIFDAAFAGCCLIPRFPSVAYLLLVRRHWKSQMLEGRHVTTLYRRRLAAPATQLP